MTIPDGLTVPDAIEPLVGFREWELIDDRGHPRLMSLFRPTVWPYDRALRAQCLRLDHWGWWLGGAIRHDVPDEVCRCGVYAHAEPGFEPANGRRDRRVVGVVLGWGRFVRGTMGWRSEYARVAALLRRDRPDLDARIATVAGRYDVPVLGSLMDALRRAA